MRKIQVLVVDDEKSLRDFVRRNLEVRGYQVATAANGLQALAAFSNQTFDLVIMDLMMPNMDGLEATRRIRQASVVPIVILSALDEERDKITAFELGADDYLTKPFGVGELLARVQAVLRRASWAESDHDKQNGDLTYHGIHIDPERHRVTLDSTELEMTPTEFRLLFELMQNPDRVLSHRDILQKVWGQEYGNEVEYLRVYIGRLRGKIESDPSNPIVLLTEHGIGYRFTSG
jgi:two-component system, OmpR family, KDP operon response regulator KdpE